METLRTKWTVPYHSLPYWTGPLSGNKTEDCNRVKDDETDRNWTEHAHGVYFETGEGEAEMFQSFL